MRIALEAVTKRYGPLAALDAVSLDVQPGQIVALVGLNAAGKTTLLQCLGGIVVPDGGQIRYDGERFYRDRLDMRRRFFFLPDTPVVLPHMSVLRHIGMVLRLYGAQTEGMEEAVVAILRELDMLPWCETRLATLSRGQTYKAALAALVAVDADVWLCDEPFASGMDPRGIQAFKRWARDAASRGRTILYSTQIMEVAEGFADRVCIIHQGRIHAFRTLTELRSETQAAADGVLQGIFQRLCEAPP